MSDKVRSYTSAFRPKMKLAEQRPSGKTLSQGEETSSCFLNLTPALLKGRGASPPCGHAGPPTASLRRTPEAMPCYRGPLGPLKFHFQSALVSGVKQPKTSLGSRQALLPIWFPTYMIIQSDPRVTEARLAPKQGFCWFVLTSDLSEASLAQALSDLSSVLSIS